jgi:superfamily I DNA and/or RNA helicase
MWEAERVNVVSDFLPDMNKSKFNEGEAGLVRVVVEELGDLGIENDDIGVITPYSAQVQSIKSLMQDKENVEVSTVDGF